MGGGRPDEDDSFIARFFGPLATAPGALGLKDDAATLAVPEGKELVLTTDAVVAGIHFFADDPPDAVARKALRVNLSDLIAKGAAPAAYLLTIALGEDWTPDWMESFAEGLAHDQEEYGVALLGGDTVATPGPMWVSIAAFGFAPEGQVPRRTGAAPGQRLYVTGTIGDASLGLLLRRDSTLGERWGLDRRGRERLLDRYLLPEPKLAAAPLVATFGTAAMDVSDGLAIDIGRLCAASGVSAIVDADQVPLSKPGRSAVAADPSLIEAVLAGGDDYEVLFAIDPADSEALEAAAADAGLPITAIGHVVERGAKALRIVRRGTELRLARAGFRHF